MPPERPSHVRIIVHQARNLISKTKHGNDCYCLISLGKERYTTEIVQNSLNPNWSDEAEFSLSQVDDDSKIKICVYHKNRSIVNSGDFIGRVDIPLPLELSHIFVKRWHPLCNKDCKVDKQRGEIEVSVRPCSQSSTGNLMSAKSRHKSSSLKNLSKHIGTKIKIPKLLRQKYTSENQLAEQTKRLDGYSTRDFLDDCDQDASSLTSESSRVSLVSTPFDSMKSVSKDHKMSVHSVIPQMKIAPTNEKENAHSPLHISTKHNERNQITPSSEDRQLFLSSDDEEDPFKRIRGAAAALVDANNNKQAKTNLTTNALEDQKENNRVNENVLSGARNASLDSANSLSDLDENTNVDEDDDIFEEIDKDFERHTGAFHDRYRLSVPAELKAPIPDMPSSEFSDLSPADTPELYPVTERKLPDLVAADPSVSPSKINGVISEKIRKEYGNKSHEQLLEAITQLTNELEAKTHKLNDLELYTEKILLHVMNSHPEILQKDYTRSPNVNSNNNFKKFLQL